MSTRRVRLGFNNGVFGLRTTLPGYDALNDDANDVTKFSFNSEWTDILKVHKYGIVPVASTDAPAPPDPGGINLLSNPWLVPVAHTLGYRPFLEARKFQSGNVVFADFHVFISSGYGDWTGCAAFAFENYIMINTFENLTFDGTKVTGGYGHNVAYVIYQWPVSV